MYVLGVNENGDIVKDQSGEYKRFDISRINIYDSTLTNIERTIQASEIKYFEPAEENVTTGQKTDPAEGTGSNQNYPKPNEVFEIVLQDPNEGVEFGDVDNRVVTVLLKVKFKYMQAKGKYTQLDVYKYEMLDDHGPCSSHSHPHTHCYRTW